MGRCTCYLLGKKARDQMLHLIRKARRDGVDYAAPIVKDPKTGEYILETERPVPPREGVASDPGIKQIAREGVYWTRATRMSPQGGAIDPAEMVYALDPATIQTMWIKPAECFCVGSRNKRRADVICYSPPTENPIWQATRETFVWLHVFTKGYLDEMKNKYKIERWRPGIAKEVFSPEDQEEGRTYIDMYKMYGEKAMQFVPYIPECRVALQQVEEE